MVCLGTVSRTGTQVGRPLVSCGGRAADGSCSSVTSSHSSCVAIYPPGTSACISIQLARRRCQNTKSKMKNFPHQGRWSQNHRAKFGAAGGWGFNSAPIWVSSETWFTKSSVVLDMEHGVSKPVHGGPNHGGTLECQTPPSHKKSE